METKGGFYITQIKQLQDRIFERLLLENGIEISGGQAVSRQMNELFYDGFSEKEQRQFEQYLARILETLTEKMHMRK